jgi:hypothetical protein
MSGMKAVVQVHPGFNSERELEIALESSHIAIISRVVVGFEVGDKVGKHVGVNEDGFALGCNVGKEDVGDMLGNTVGQDVVGEVLDG